MHQLSSSAVRIKTWSPSLQATPKALRSKCDFYSQRMLKYDGEAEYHSYAEYLKGFLNDGNPNVFSWTPQPFRFYIGKRLYIPDAFVKYTDGRRVIEELKPRGEFDLEVYEPLRYYCNSRDVDFEVVSNEEVIKEEGVALNWKRIVQTLVKAMFLVDTENIELSLHQKLIVKQEYEFGELLEMFGKSNSYQVEVAIFRMLFKNKFYMRLESKPLDFDTKVYLR